MDVLSTYAYSTAAWLSLQAVPLLLTPKLIIGMLTGDLHKTTDLETFLCRLLAIAFFTLALSVLFFTGTIPLTNLSEPISLDSTSPTSSIASALVSITTLFHFTAMTYHYVRYTNFSSHSDAIGQVGYLLGAIGYGGLACIGGWCILFGGERGRYSKRTGADKRMVGFPFKNESAYNKKVDRKAR